MNPYENIPVEQWQEITCRLVEKHPLTLVIVDICLKSWQSILHGKINTYLNMQIKEMSVSPQATGALLHDVIPEYISKNISGFRKGVGSEKDIGLVQQPGWVVSQVLQNALHFAVSSGCCSITEVIEQLYCMRI
jgi:hypothetical protein